METVRIDPGTITKPIQILTVFFAALVLLVALFLETGLRAEVEGQRWLLLISAIMSVALYTGLVFLLLTRFRPHLQEDDHYLRWYAMAEGSFRDFKAEESAEVADVQPDSVPQGEKLRQNRYKESQGLFLVHRWRPSKARNQVADIMIRLAQHRKGPLSKNEIESVTYYLGSKFFDGQPSTKKNAKEHFKLEISAYGPLLCRAEVSVRGSSSPPIVLERYIDFDGLESESW